MPNLPRITLLKRKLCAWKLSSLSSENLRIVIPEYRAHTVHWWCPLVEELYGTRYQTGSVSLIYVGSGSISLAS